MHINRRLVIAGLAVSAAFAGNGRSQAGAQETPAGARFAYVGSRTTKERKARGKGIEVFALGESEHDWRPVQTVDGLVNPSFLIRDRSGHRLFTVHGDQQEVSSFAVDLDTGRLRLLSTATTGGKNPVHMHFDEGRGVLVVANYASGTVVSIPVSDEGELGAITEPLVLNGVPGPHKTEQTSSHPHHVVAVPGTDLLLVPDKGLDCIFTMRLGEGNRIEDVAELSVRQGAGPRHVAVTPDGRFAYVINELDSTVATYGVEATTGRLTPLQILPSIPSRFVGDNRAAAMVASKDGRWVYASNRGHNSVVRFVVDADGLLRDPAWINTAGKGPRFACLSPSGATLFAANELTDTIVPFAVDQNNGSLRTIGTPVSTGSPVSILFI